MNIKVKGLLKGLRYISQMFDAEEKEPEMQIGLPTDVKHVAHIGWDGPSVNSNPAWMNDFHSQPINGTTFGDGEIICSPRSASQEIPVGGSDGVKPQRRSRRHASSESAVPGSANGSESPSSPKAHRHSRRNGSESVSDGSRRNGRRSSKNAEASGSGSVENGPGSESPARDLPSIPKQRRRKTKTGSDDGSTRSSTRSKNPSFSDADPDDKIAHSVPHLAPIVEGGPM